MLIDHDSGRQCGRHLIHYNKRALSYTDIACITLHANLLENSQVIDFYSLKNPDQLVETSCMKNPDQLLVWGN